ncbi:MAG: Rpn family recombination-promoting nuclease/putative transposase [Pirellula sp.]|nr:Rpn family recombination-promoting nuclease/putative transposase [Pirellula sp.]
MSMKIGIRAWIDFAFRKIFGKPGNEICLISLLNAVLRFPHPVVSVEYLNPFGIKDFETDKLICVAVKATDRLVDRESGRVLDDSIEIHTVELAKYNGAQSDVPVQASWSSGRIGSRTRVNNGRGVAGATSWLGVSACDRRVVCDSRDNGGKANGRCERESQSGHPVQFDRRATEGTRRGTTGGN